MRLTILTPNRRLVVDQEVTDVFAPGVEGELEILPLYANFITELLTGVVRWKTDTGWQVASISYGWLEVFEQKISILADVGELAADIDKNRALQAEAKAAKLVTEGGLNDAEYQKAELKLKRAISRINALKSAN